MAQSNYYLNGVKIKRPNEFTIERYKISSLQRLANGDQAGDYIASKRTFQFSYSAITADDLNSILNVIWKMPTMFFTLTIVENNTTTNYTVYPGAIPSTLHRTGSNWVWKNVEFQLIQK